MVQGSKNPHVGTQRYLDQTDMIVWIKSVNLRPYGNLVRYLHMS